MIKRRQIRLVSALFGLSALGMASSVHAEIFPGNIFELRPPRVRVATPEETADNTGQRQGFAYDEAPPAAPPQESIYLTDADQLAAVFPVSNGSFYSGGVGYAVGGLSVEGNIVTVDYYNFRTFGGPYGAALVPAWEQSVFIGNLSAGDYVLNLRRWALNAEDRMGFDKSQVDLLTFPEDAPVFVIAETPAVRYYTEGHFPFSVVSTVVPEPATLSLVGSCLAVFSVRRRKRA